MRILQVAYKADISGGERVLLQLVEGLVAERHEVHLVAPAEGPVLEAGARLSAFPHVVPFATTYDLAAVLRLAGVLRDRRIELVHSHGMLVNVLTRVAAAIAGTPRHVSTVHLTLGLGDPRGDRTWRDFLKGRLWYRPLDNATASLSDRVVAVSQAVADDLVRQGQDPGRIVVIGNGIDTTRYRPLGPEARQEERRRLGWAAEAFVVGSAARLSPQKDPLSFLAAVARLVERSPRPVVAWMAGDGPLFREAEARIRELGLGDVVRLLGNRDDVARLLAASDAYALSSRWEGMPLSVLEAMATGLPVAATSVPGTAEVVVDGGTGTLVPIGDGAALGEALSVWAADPGRGAALGRAGRERIEARFSVVRTVGEHLALYRELLGSRP